MIFNLCFLAKTLIDLAFLEIKWWLPLLLSLLFYFLSVRCDSTCIENEGNLSYSDNRKCKVCNHFQILRMKHCEICQKCIHKYDHHCKLMEVCIGEFNHKYYICFLISYIVSQLIMNWQVLSRIGDHLWLDENGIERRDCWYFVMVLQLCLYGLILPLFCSFLLARHIGLILHNSTTWEEGRRSEITYLKELPDTKDFQYPFSRGWRHNLKHALLASRNRIEMWRLPMTTK